MSEQLTESSQLPQLPSEEAFRHPLLYLAVKSFWEDESLVDLEAAVNLTINQANATLVGSSLKLLDDLAHEIDDEEYYRFPFAWQRIDENSYNINEEGIITAAIGRLSDAHVALERSVSYICDHLWEHELETVIDNDEYYCVSPISLFECIEEEIERRETAAIHAEADRQDRVSTASLF